MRLRLILASLIVGAVAVATAMWMAPEAQPEPTPASAWVAPSTAAPAPALPPVVPTPPPGPMLAQPAAGRPNAAGATPGRPSVTLPVGSTPATNPRTGVVTAPKAAAPPPVVIKPTVERSPEVRAQMREVLRARMMSALEERENAAASSLGVFDGQGDPPQVMAQPREVVLVKAGSFDGDLRNLPQQPVRRRERPERDEPVRELVPRPGTAGAATPEVAIAPPVPSAPAPAPIQNFDGMDRVTWGSGHPPDTNGDVGPNHVIESVNASVAIYNKTGVLQTAFTLDTFMSQGIFGNLCDTDNFGDPVVLYDTFENRWIITDFAFQLDGGNNVVSPPGMFQCFAASKTGDPLAGGWNFYSFNTTGGLGDYGKFGIWPDGLYMSFNMFDYAAAGGFQNVRLVAMNKAQMYAGAPTVQMVEFNLDPAEFSLLPSNARLQTGTPPAGTPNFLTTVKFTNSLSVWKFQVNWAKIALSTLTGPFESVTPALAIFSGPGGRVPTQSLSVDALFPRLMMQNQYSNISGVESLWNSHTVGTAGDATRAGSRWYQVRVTGGTVEANAVQAVTHSPLDPLHRWMPSVAVNKNGDMALGFNVANISTHPGLSYAGRLAADAVNTLPLTDQTLVAGTGSPTTSNRWGDYATMTLDPDGCTFWFFGEYYAVTGSNWNTRIGSFRYPGCTDDTTGSITGTVRNAASTPLPGVLLKLGTRTTTTNALGEYSFASLPDGTYPSITAMQNGYNSSTFTNIVVPGGGSAVQNFTLTKPASLSGCFVDTALADFQTDVASVNCDLATAAGTVRLTQPVLIDQQNTSVTLNGFGVNSTSWAGQTFTAGLTGTLQKAELQLFCSGCSGTFPNLTVSIRAVDAGTGLPVGGDLATATVAGFNSNFAVYYTATFAAPPNLTTGNQYAIIVRPVSNPSAGTYAYTCSCTPNTNPYGAGLRVTSANSGGAWVADASGRDFAFRVHVLAGYAASGTFTSSLKDGNPGVGGATTWGTIDWTASVPGGTTLQFRVAGSDSPDGPFAFVGPDGTAGTFFSDGGSLAQFNGKRYLRYQASMTSTGANTPVINDVTICYNGTPRPQLDLNADGTGDVFTYSFSGGAWKRAVANGTGGFVEANGMWNPNWLVTPAKFNQDDLTDMFLFNATSGQWFRMLNDGASGFTTQASGTWWNGWQRYLMDLNGDGITDVFLYDPASGVWFKAVISANQAGDFVYAQGGWNPNWQITQMTLNNDALGDMFLFNQTTGRWFWVLGEAGPTFTYPASETWFNGWVFYPGDFNADGLSDLLLHHPATGNYFVARNNGLGTGFLYTSGGWSLGWTPYVGDFDADGDQDLFLHSQSTGQWFQMLSNGVGGFSVGGSQTWSLGWNIYPTDLNNDGRTDFLLYHPTTGVWYQARNFSLGTFTYTTGNWAANLTIVVRPPFY